MRPGTLPLLCGAGLLVAACGSTDVGRNDFKYPSQLNANPALFDGQEVLVRGYLELEPEAHSLVDSREIVEAGKQQWKSGTFDPPHGMEYCLTIINPSFFDASRAKLRGHTIMVRGRFVAKYLTGNFVDLGACGVPSGIVVDKIVREDLSNSDTRNSATGF